MRLVTGSSLFDALAASDRALLRREPLPRQVEPMKAVLSHTPFSDPGWIFERKLDGIRCVAIARPGSASLLSRNQLSLNGRFPEVAKAMEAVAQDVVLDGEVVALVGGQTSFAALQQRGTRRVSVFFYVFDLLHLGGFDTTALPLHERKRLLRRAMTFRNPLRLSAYRRERGEAMLEQACRRRWEGLIAKREDSPYVHARSNDWLKLKCTGAQELVIGGYTAPRGSRTDLGALLLGYYDKGLLRYAGRVGSGFTQATLQDLAEKLRPLQRSGSPFADEVRVAGATWVEPKLVAEIRFTEWTRDGRLRHPVFAALRDDKAAADVVRE
jgi:bifunctional non-homologous end joining protein LigD